MGMILIVIVVIAIVFLILFNVKSSKKGKETIEANHADVFIENEEPDNKTAEIIELEPANQQKQSDQDYRNALRNFSKQTSEEKPQAEKKADEAYREALRSIAKGNK